MATITIRNLEEDVKRRLRIVAAEHGHSMEAEVREILTQAALNPRSVQRSTTGNRKKRKFEHLTGIWKGRGTTDKLMQELRGDD